MGVATPDIIRIGLASSWGVATKASSSPGEPARAKPSGMAMLKCGQDPRAPSSKVRVGGLMDSHALRSAALTAMLLPKTKSSRLGQGATHRRSKYVETFLFYTAGIGQFVTVYGLRPVEAAGKEHTTPASGRLPTSTSYPSCAFLCKEPASRRKTGLTGSLMCYGSNGRSGCEATSRGKAVDAAQLLRDRGCRGAAAAGLAWALPHYDHGSRSKRGSGIGLRSEKGS